MECWSIGVLAQKVLVSRYYSIPLLQYSKVDISGKIVLVIVSACFRKLNQRSGSNHFPWLSRGGEHTGP
jgi:ligand-binding sensor protein